VARRPKPGEAPPSGDLEARVTSLNPRGYPYRLWEKEFPPDQWVDVTEDEAGQLLWLSPFVVRLKETP
jgi:hypothetical protein